MTEYTSVADVKKESGETQLRNVDLNLLTVFDAVMQMQNVTRAAELLGMSQPGTGVFGKFYHPRFSNVTSCKILVYLLEKCGMMVLLRRH